MPRHADLMERFAIDLERAQAPRDEGFRPDL
jgi:hypothetical protein